MTQDEQHDAIERESLLRLQETGPALLARLANDGFPAAKLCELPGEMLFAWDVARKAAGAHGGPIGRAGCHVYEVIAKVDWLDPDWSVSAAGRIVNADELAYEAACSRNTADRAVRALVEHGFMERTREGRAFRLRPLIPETALIDAARRAVELADDDPTHLDQPWRAREVARWRRVLADFI